MRRKVRRMRRGAGRAGGEGGMFKLLLGYAKEREAAGNTQRGKEVKSGLLTF